MSERKPKEYLSDEDIMDYHRETVATESEQSELRFTLQAIALWIGKYDAANATIATLTAERDALVEAASQLRQAQRDYMAAGDLAAKGKIIGEKAKALDATLAQLKEQPND